ncbi:MAG: GTP-binding protein [Gammaproteobacteria bacterium]|nr:GTP-binding protein [Gammaproteobacteria bacterium]
MNKIPVAIVSGFLGAGKTTLLNRLLRESGGRRTAVLVNDFGELSIDAELIARVEGETISLANGCICCNIRGDLVRALLQLLEREPLPDEVIIETSGISDPGAAAMGLVVSPALAARVQLDAIVTLVDTENVLSLAGTDAALAEDQVKAADLVVINKIDRAAPGQIADIRNWLTAVSPGARVLEVSHGRVPREFLFGPGKPVNGRGTAGERVVADHGHDHGRTHDSFSWTAAEPLAFTATYALFKSLPLFIYRAKGFLHLDSVPERRVILQMVGRRVSLSKGEAWEATPPQSKVVMIGPAGQLDPALLRQRLEGCLARHHPPTQNRLAEAVLEILRSP